jgi:hypothetical protein
MSRSALRSLRLLGPLSFAAALGIGTLPAFAQTMPMTGSGECSSIRFELSNPDPGARVEPGGLVLQGVAMDDRASQGPGIDRIDFFLDSREQGGINIGTAVPGMTTGPFGADSFQTTVQLPQMIGGHDLFAYAHSSVNGAESVISVPIAVGEDESKAFVTPPPDTVNEMCMVGSAGAVTSTTTTTPSTTTTTPSTTTTTTTPSNVTFEVGNPSPGDTIHAGGLVIEGSISNASGQSMGVDRIDIFLDNRDEGGMLIGHGSMGTGDTWSATVELPNNQLGLHTLFFFAHMPSGQEMVVSVPVTVAP